MILDVYYSVESLFCVEVCLYFGCQFLNGGVDYLRFDLFNVYNLWKLWLVFLFI